MSKKVLTMHLESFIKFTQNGFYTPYFDVSLSHGDIKIDGLKLERVQNSRTVGIFYKDDSKLFDNVLSELQVNYGDDFFTHLAKIFADLIEEVEMGEITPENFRTAFNLKVIDYPEQSIDKAKVDNIKAGFEKMIKNVDSMTKEDFLELDREVRESQSVENASLSALDDDMGM